MKHQYSLAYLTIPGTNPVDQIEIAKACGYDGVSLRTISMHLPGEPDYHLADTALKEQVKAALKRTGMKCFDIELGRVGDGLDVRTYEPELAVAKELGCEWIISSVWTSDMAFAVEQEQLLCDLCAKYGIRVNLEFVTFANVTNVQEAKAFAEKVNRPNLYIMVDVLHVYRSHNVPEDLRSIPKEKFGFMHLCDGPEQIPAMDAPEMKGVAREARLYLGEGGIDCAAYIKEVPAAPYYSIELPNQKNMDLYGKMGHAKRCLESAQAICEKL